MRSKNRHTLWKRDGWFHKLNPTAKLVYAFANDTCDPAGVFIVDINFINHRLGFPVSVKAEDILEEFQRAPAGVINNRVLPIAGGQKWWLTDYVVRNYGTGLNELHPPHIPAFKSLRAHGLVETLAQLHPGFKLTKTKHQEVLKLKNPKKIWTPEQVEESIAKLNAEIAELKSQTVLDAMLGKQVVTPEAEKQILHLERRKQTIVKRGQRYAADSSGGAVVGQGR
jgi:hypothetical protein